MKTSNHRLLLLVGISFWFLMMGISLIREYRYRVCDTTVELNNGVVLAGSAVNYYTNLGVIDLVGCDGSRTTIRTNVIKKITEK